MRPRSAGLLTALLLLATVHASHAEGSSQASFPLLLLPWQAADDASLPALATRSCGAGLPCPLHLALPRRAEL